ncbi:GNAT family N-acetyltransferase [Nocardioides marmoribigeumensis]|jgi:ribosomal-protein-alanine N-acetyltransferase|uniref:Ribosomal-protein-alanine N-acetyltransferase n=1 Tax=Nocardioides marmoribigeumensis TaxID=433649 RepID=A0ABU2BWS9_9ACTN|nr:GNAT family protein [Nocardioides marmoribigeumensis]MDR7362119.1 ribosomal-protein-alanine N-acetyltransferase [Nocardioides marmoribigeumensis]
MTRHGVQLLPGYEVRPLAAGDAAALAQAYVRNREHLAPWEPPRAVEFFTEAGQLADAEGKLAAAAAGQQDPWIIWRAGEVVGRVNLSNIARGAFQSASLGYWVDHRHTGRGVASAAVGFAVQRATEMGLHRLEAGTLADNQPSRAVLRRCGFTEYGRAAQYLFIAGAWQDHVLFQRILHTRDAL